MIKNTYLLFLMLLFGISSVLAQTVKIEDAVRSPGDVTIAVTMSDFTTASGNGSVQTIQYKIAFDANLLYFKGISSVDPNFTGWVVPGNGASSPVTLIYTNMTGHDIDGKIFDLKFGYAGGFTGNINFVTNGCEIVRGGTMTPMTNVTYNNGTISQTPPDATVDMGAAQPASVGSLVTVPVNMQGPGLNPFKAFTYKIGYDPIKLTFVQAINYAGLGGSFAASANSGVITVTWNGTFSSPSPTEVFDLKFNYNGGGDAAVVFQPGSQIVNSSLALIPTAYTDGLVQNLPSGSSLTIPPSSGALDADVLVPVDLNYLGSGFIGSINLKIGYNNSILTYKGINTIGCTLSSGVVASAANGVITIVWDNSNNTSSLNGTLLKLKFTTIANGLSPLTFNGGSVLTQTNLSNVPLTYNNGSFTVGALNPNPTLSGASQAASVCAGSSATINLTGLLAGSTSTISYTINGVSQPAVAGVVANGSGNSSFITSVLSSGNNGQNLQITGITCTSFSPNTSSAFTQNVTLSVNPVSVGGTVASAQTICSGTSPADLTLTGNTGNVVNWESSVDAGFTSPATIAGITATLAGATIGNLSANTYFRAVVQSGVCATANSAYVLVTVNPVSVGGTVASAQTICSGTSPADLTLTGNTGNVINWQSSADAGFLSPAIIAGTSATLAGATIGNLSANTHFRAVVQSGVCATANSASVLITVNPAAITSSPSNQTINLSANTSFGVTATCAASYAWQVSTDNGISYSPLADGGVYSNVGTPTMNITGAVAAMNGYMYKCVVQPGSAESTAATLTVNPLTVNVKVMLQGAYNGTDLNITLRTLSRIPLAQPYGVAPYNTTAFTYSGTESVASYPANIVDWVLVELRTGTASGTMVGKKAGFVLKSGSIVGIDGVSPLAFPGLNIGNYYIVVRHRNHLPIMSAAAQALSSTSTLYDFTTAMNKAYGTNPMATLAGGRFGLWGGNANLNNNVRYGGPSNDPAAISTAIGTSVINVYTQYDVNMNGNARYGGPANDPAAISTFVGILVVTSQVP